MSWQKVKMEYSIVSFKYKKALKQDGLVIFIEIEKYEPKLTPKIITIISSIPG